VNVTVVVCGAFVLSYHVYVTGTVFETTKFAFAGAGAAWLFGAHIAPNGSDTLTVLPVGTE
jgi:hypothetical protein